nr:glycine receptor subunit alpha-4-like [Lepeophtheirus salmonis]
MRPPKPGGAATTVSFHVTVMSLDTIDEGSMTYAADVFFAQEWKDHRLILPDNMTREYRLLPVEWLHLIWRPDSFFKNAKKVTFQTMTIPNHYLWLYKDKTILYMVKLTLLLSCPMNFENYPHDEQNCKLSMESLSHTTDDLIFIWLPEDKTPLAVDNGIQLPQLELVSNDTGDCTSVYSTGNFTCLEVIFKFRRRLGYYLFHTYIPTCLIVMMSWISFWIKPEAVPARVTLGVTSLLTLSTQHANSQKSLPPVSYIKAIDMFMSSCTVFVFLSLIEYAFVNVMMGDISEVERKDKTAHLRNIIVTANSNITYNIPKLNQRMNSNKVDDVNYIDACPKHSGDKLDDDIGDNNEGTNNNLNARRGLNRIFNSRPNTQKRDPKEIMKKRRERAICIDRVSRVIFPSTFILLNIVYWLIFSEILDTLKEKEII